MVLHGGKDTKACLVVIRMEEAEHQEVLRTRVGRIKRGEVGGVRGLKMKDGCCARDRREKLGCNKRSAVWFELGNAASCACYCR
jgi:hypothetical protein